jgi:hypothetical protein
MKTTIAPPSSGAEDKKRSYLSQTDVPSYGLEPALRIGQALADHYGKNPTKPLRVAQALEMVPTSSTFRMLAGASIAYGLTEGGYNSGEIALTALGRRVFAPVKEGDELSARREAVLRPRVLREFLTRYNDSKLPAPSIARNVLEEMGVPPDRADQTFNLIVSSAELVGFLREVKGHKYVDLGHPISPAKVSKEAEITSDEDEDEAGAPDGGTRDDKPQQPGPAVVGRLSRVFVTHGKNKEIVAQLKELLTFGGFTPVVAIEHETVSKPVPDKVLDDLRSCQAAIIHVGTETRLIDSNGKEHRVLNENVLIEIGAAMALYGRNFILLVEKGTTLPTNLQGLYEVRYEGEKLDYEATMRLLKAFNDFRS